MNYKEGYKQHRVTSAFLIHFLSKSVIHATLERYQGNVKLKKNIADKMIFMLIFILEYLLETVYSVT